MKFELIDYDIKIQDKSIRHDIIPLYLEGKTIPYIAKKFHIKDYQELRNSINKYIKMTKEKIQNKRIEAINPEDIFNLKKQGKSVAQIEALYNLTSYGIEKIFGKYCIENNIDRKQFSRRKLENVDSEELVRKIKDGMTMEQLSNEYNVSIPAIRNRVLQVISLIQLKELYSRNRTKKYVGEERAHEMLELYEQGIPKDDIALRFGCSHAVVQKLLAREYGKIGRTSIPKIVNKNTFLTILNMNETATREELIKQAEELNAIIPKAFLDEHYGFEEIEINKIRKFVINKFSDENLGDEDRRIMFRSFNIAKSLKENGFGTKHQTVALLYLLPQFYGISMEEIYIIVNNNEDIIKSIEAIISDESNQEEYLKRLKIGRFATEVKLAIVLEEIKEHTLRKEKIDFSKYKAYIKMANHTKFQEEYEFAISENENCLNGEDR